MKKQILITYGLILTAILVIFFFAPAHITLVAVGIYLLAALIISLLCGIAGILFFQWSPGKPEKKPG